MIDEKSVSLIAESIGSNLIRLYGEMDKLFLTLPQGVAVTPELVEKNIGTLISLNCKTLWWKRMLTKLFK